MKSMAHPDVLQFPRVVESTEADDERDLAAALSRDKDLGATSQRSQEHVPQRSHADREQEEDALMMATSREWDLPRQAEATGIDERWVSAFLSLRFADLLAQHATGERLKRLSPADRAWLKEQCEQLVEDAVARFKPHTGDPEYQPQDEPEYDFEGRTLPEVEARVWGIPV